MQESRDSCWSDSAMAETHKEVENVTFSSIFIFFFFQLVYEVHNDRRKVDKQLFCLRVLLHGKNKKGFHLVTVYCTYYPCHLFWARTQMPKQNLLIYTRASTIFLSSLRYITMQDLYNTHRF